jgi:hypothetical protein
MVEVEEISKGGLVGREPPAAPEDSVKMQRDLEKDPHSGYEASDAEVKPILIFLIGLAGLIVVALVGMAVLFNVLDARLGRTDREISPLIDTLQIPPGPLLQVDPAQELKDLLDWEERMLTGYGWVDEDTGVFRIPIERAIEIVAETGLPARALREGEEE